VNRLAATRLVASAFPGQGPRAFEIEPDSVDWEILLAVASEHAVLPAVHLLVESGCTPPDPGLREDLATIYRLNRKRNSRYLKEVEAIVLLLNRLGVEPVLLKGLARIAKGAYFDSALRVVGDIDLLVPAERLSECADALYDHGYKRVPHDAWNDPDAKHYPRLAKSGRSAPVELHRALCDIPWRGLLPAKEALECSTRHQLGAASCRLLSPEHALVHTVVHSQLDDRNHWLRLPELRQLYDFALLMGAAESPERVMLIESRFRKAGLSHVLQRFTACAAYFFSHVHKAGELHWTATLRIGYVTDPPRVLHHLHKPGAWLGWYLLQAGQGPAARGRILGKFRDRTARSRLRWRLIHWLQCLFGRWPPAVRPHDY
jgi:putative nucleotidyltransferase-like protein